MPTVLTLSKRAKAASRTLATAPTNKKNAALVELAKLLEKNQEGILKANELDVRNAKRKKHENNGFY